MRQICDEIGLTVQLAILGGDELVYVEKTEPPDLVVRINARSARVARSVARLWVRCCAPSWDGIWYRRSSIRGIRSRLPRVQSPSQMP
jgi:hypothetical protein